MAGEMLPLDDAICQSISGHSVVTWPFVFPSSLWSKGSSNPVCGQLLRLSLQRGSSMTFLSKGSSRHPSAGPDLRLGAGSSG